MNGYRILLGIRSHAGWVDHYQRSYRSACELMAGPIGDDSIMRRLKRTALASMTLHAVEHDREQAHGN